MKANSFASIKPLKTTQFWLLAIAGALVAVDLSLSWRIYADVNQLSISILCWGAVLTLLSEKRHTLKLESDVFSSLLGLLLIAFVLFRSWFIITFDTIYIFSPLIAGLGLALVASGVKGLKQYWQELLIILALNLPEGILMERIDISLFTARVGSSILTYLGFDVVRQGVNIILPTGAVEVYHGCSGLDSIIRLVRIAVVYLVMFPTNLAKIILVPAIAIVVAFAVNAVRVALMAFLVAYSSKEAFDYWHLGTGSQIFFLITILVFSLCCYLLSKKADDSDNHDPMELSGS